MWGRILCELIGRHRWRMWRQVPGGYWIRDCRRCDVTEWDHP